MSSRTVSLTDTAHSYFFCLNTDLTSSFCQTKVRHPGLSWTLPYKSSKVTDPLQANTSALPTARGFEGLGNYTQAHLDSRQACLLIFDKPCEDTHCTAAHAVSQAEVSREIGVWVWCLFTDQSEQGAVWLDQSNTSLVDGVRLRKHVKQRHLLAVVVN